MDFVHKTDIGHLIVDQAKSKEDSQRSRISVGTWIAFLTGACAGLEWKRNSFRPSLQTYHAVLVPVQYLRAGLLFAPRNTNSIILPYWYPHARNFGELVWD